MAGTNVNKLVMNGNTEFDLTGDTVSPETMLLGETAHDKSGAGITGTYDPISVKTLAYTGTGSSINTITFPEKPTVIFQIQTVEDPNNAVGICPFIYGENGMFVWYGSKFTPGSVSTYHSLLSYNGLSMTITGADPGAAQNTSGKEYKVYYI